MISILLLYIIYQEQLISTDPLTGLNNRNRFETYMLSLFSNVDQAEDVYLLMMDAEGLSRLTIAMDMLRAIMPSRSYLLRSKRSARRLVALSHVMVAMSSWCSKRQRRNRTSWTCVRRLTTSSRAPRFRICCGCPSAMRGLVMVSIPGKTCYALPMRSSTASRPRKRKLASRYARKRGARLRAWRPSAHRCTPLN